MTNEEAKQEAIKKAYGEYYEKCNPNSDGWVSVEYVGYRLLSDNHPEKFGFEEVHTVPTGSGTFKWRLNSLSAIKDNAGWIRIEPDGSNLPTDSSEYKVLVDGFTDVKISFIDENKWVYWWTASDGGKHLFGYENVTHYKPITPELPPVY